MPVAPPDWCGSALGQLYPRVSTILSSNGSSVHTMPNQPYPKRRGGPPRLSPDGQRRTTRVVVPATPAEVLALNDYAQATGQTVSNVIRAAIAGTVSQAYWPPTQEIVELSFTPPETPRK